MAVNYYIVLDSDPINGVYLYIKSEVNRQNTGAGQASSDKELFIFIQTVIGAMLIIHRIYISFI